MDNMHPVMQAALAAFAPPKQSFNDDDIYVIDLVRRVVIRHYGASSHHAAYAKYNGESLDVGQALVKGMTAKHIIGDGK